MEFFLLNKAFKQNEARQSFLWLSLRKILPAFQHCVHEDYVGVR